MDVDPISSNPGLSHRQDADGEQPAPSTPISALRQGWRGLRHRLTSSISRALFTPNLSRISEVSTPTPAAQVEVGQKRKRAYNMGGSSTYGLPDEIFDSASSDEEMASPPRVSPPKDKPLDQSTAEPNASTEPASKEPTSPKPLPKTPGRGLDDFRPRKRVRFADHPETSDHVPSWRSATAKSRPWKRANKKSSLLKSSLAKRQPSKSASTEQTHSLESVTAQTQFSTPAVGSSQFTKSSITEQSQSLESVTAEAQPLTPAARSSQSSKSATKQTQLSASVTAQTQSLTPAAALSQFSKSTTEQTPRSESVTAQGQSSTSATAQSELSKITTERSQPPEPVAAEAQPSQSAMKPSQSSKSVTTQAQSSKPSTEQKSDKKTVTLKREYGPPTGAKFGLSDDLLDDSDSDVVVELDENGFIPENTPGVSQAAIREHNANLHVLDNIFARAAMTSSPASTTAPIQVPEVTQALPSTSSPAPGPTVAQARVLPPVPPPERLGGHVIDPIVWEAALAIPESEYMEFEWPKVGLLPQVKEHLELFEVVKRDWEAAEA